MPKYSIVIPAFNAARTIASAVSSALAQTESDLEVIVVDDGSTDDTARTVEGVSDPRVRLVSQANRGLPGARNAGIATAVGTYLSFLDADDLLMPDYLELLGGVLAADPAAGLAYTDAYAFDDRTGRVRRGSAMYSGFPPDPAPTESADFLFELLQRNFVYVCTTVPRSVFAIVGTFNENLTASEDYDMWLRVVAKGYRAVHVPGRHALYRLHANQMSRDEAKLKRNELAVYSSLEMAEMPSPQHRERLAARRQQAQRELRIATGEARASSLARGLRYRLGALRQRIGSGEYAWYRRAPDEVTEAFPDLRSV